MIEAQKEKALRVIAVGFVISAAALAGCGRGSHESRASGTVTLDGKPLDKGTVTFHPVRGGAAAYSQIGEDGGYAIRTGRKRGLSTGKYVVTVVATEAAFSEKTHDLVPGRHLAPPRYAQVETSDLRFAVEGGNNKIDLKLYRE